MSDKTNRLRELLDERGVEYTTNDHMGAYETSWNGFTATQLSPNANLIMAVTPEQAIAATLGGGKLTAEQVSEAVYSHSTHADCVDADWQAIADELNELGSGTYIEERIAEDQKQLNRDMRNTVNAVTNADAESRWHELFGTPERAARTLAGIKCDDGGCEGCTLYGANCSYDENVQLEWLRGDV